MGVIVGTVAVFASILCASFFPNDTKEKRPPSSIFALACEEFGVLTEFFRIPTFWIMVGQGVFGTIPWSVMWIMTRFYLAGGAMARDQVALVTSLNPVWGIFGALLGGYICDFLAAKFGYQGRPLGAQVSVALAASGCISSSTWLLGFWHHGRRVARIFPFFPRSFQLTSGAECWLWKVPWRTPLRTPLLQIWFPLSPWFSSASTWIPFPTRRESMSLRPEPWVTRWVFRHASLGCFAS